MCGIAGIVGRTELTLELRNAVARMNDGLEHRGPDGRGEFFDAGIVMAMRRLSIIDPEGGQQPLFDEDKSVVLIANGEIYNSVELRIELEAGGHQFRTGSDCETIVHLYEEYGEQCVHHLRGMFAFALWDKRRRRLLLARDRMGEKPLYLFQSDGRLIFASEMKALLASGFVSFALDPVAVDLFFHYQYVPEPRTMIKGVRKLDAGCLLTVDVDTWRVIEHQYWNMEDASPIEGDPVECIRAELDRVSELVLRSDVPVGIALSGGLDSSAIAVLAAKKYPGKLHAFTVGYSGRPDYDERNDAARLAAWLDIPFHEIEVDTEEMNSYFPELVKAQDDPIADISGYCYYMVSKCARENGVPVLLQGQGGDELFWGYPWVRESVAESKRKQMLLSLGWGALPAYLKCSLPDGSAPWQIRLWLEKFCGLKDGWQHFKYDKRSPVQQMVLFDKTPDFADAVKDMPDLYTREFLSQIADNNSADLFKFPEEGGNLDVYITSLIVKTYLRENGIAQGDRLSMASSVEMRLPLLDYKLVETVIGLRKQHHDYKKPPKTWLKSALQDVVPEWVVNRPKRGFEPPIREWYKKLFAEYGKELNNGYLVENNVLTEECGRSLLREYVQGRSVSPVSFKALVLELWCRGMM